MVVEVVADEAPEEEQSSAKLPSMRMLVPTTESGVICRLCRETPPPPRWLADERWIEVFG